MSSPRRGVISSRSNGLMFTPSSVVSTSTASALDVSVTSVGGPSSLESAGAERVGFGGGAATASIGRLGLVSNAANRVRVAARCRPPFEEEGSESAVTIGPRGPNNERPRTLQLDCGAGKVREFSFDVVFDGASTNADVYDVVAGPVVDGVMRGVNGTVLAYGQTGSGKTYSLGILTRVVGENGIVPRALSHIFGFAATSSAAAAAASPASSPPPPLPTTTVTMSFLQIYLDSVQDLLSSNAGAAASAAAAAVASTTMSAQSSNTSMSMGTTSVRSSGGGPSTASGSLATLAVREDPSRGFYVEGLSEYTVTSFDAALSLLNWGLENRVVGATKMNATSSRSHTVLFVRVETKTPVAQPASTAADSADHASRWGYTTRRAQLVLCDLAGSERVRRTSSRGARLDEARAINASLHTLGQVIVALAALSSQARGDGGAGHGNRIHVPWRDNKLTRILYGNLGGSSNTYLLATLGPSMRNANETLSTLTFAARCMRVDAHPVVSLTLQGASEYAELAARLQARLNGVEALHAAELAAISRRYEMQIADVERRATSVSSPGRYAAPPRSPPLATVSVSLLSDHGGAAEGDSSAVIKTAAAAAYEALLLAHETGVKAIEANGSRAVAAAKAWAAAIDAAKANSSVDESANDPLFAELAGGLDDVPEIAASRVPYAAADAMASVHAQFMSNSVAAAVAGAAGRKPSSLLAPPSRAANAPRAAPSDPAALMSAVRSLGAACADNSTRLDSLCAAKDSAFDDMKRALASSQAAVTRREADLRSQSFVLKYLVETTTALRGALRRAGGSIANARDADGGGEAKMGTLTSSMASPTSLRSPPTLELSLSSPPSRRRIAIGGVSDDEDASEDEDRGAGMSGFDAYAARAASSSSGAAAAIEPRGRPPFAPKAATQKAPSPTIGLGEDADDQADAIESIVGHRVVNGAGGSQKLLYRVHWRGSDANGSEDEWFAREDLAADFPALVATFEASLRTRISFVR